MYICLLVFDVRFALANRYQLSHDAPSKLILSWEKQREENEYDKALGATFGTYVAAVPLNYKH